MIEPLTPSSARRPFGRRRVLLVALVALAVGFAAGHWPAAVATPSANAAASVSAAPSPATSSMRSATTSSRTAVADVARTVGPAVVSVTTDLGLGSGVIYDPSGLILTNAHVVDGAQVIRVALADGRHFDGRILGADRGFDVAVVKIDATGLPSAPLGSSARLEVGQPVVAIGNPYGFDHTVTTGVVSAVDRPVSEGSGSYQQPMIQTDAAINPGNSGGPLIDLDGRVIGVTTLIATPDGLPAAGLGFAVPVDTASRIASQLVTHGKVTASGQPYLGVSLAAGQTLAERGAPVGSVAPGGPTERSGLRAGDRITALGGTPVYTTNELLQALVRHRPGETLRLEYTRAGTSHQATIVIGEAPAL